MYKSMYKDMYKSMYESMYKDMYNGASLVVIYFEVYTKPRYFSKNFIRFSMMFCFMAV
jgi:hypothetical protein